MPVVAPQASVQTTSAGAAESNLATAISGRTVASAKALVPMKWRSGSPPRDRRVVPSGRYPCPCCSRMASLACPGLGELQLLDHQRRAELLEDSGADLHLARDPIGGLARPSPR